MVLSHIPLKNYSSEKSFLQSILFCSKFSPSVSQTTTKKKTKEHHSSADSLCLGVFSMIYSTNVSLLQRYFYCHEPGYDSVRSGWAIRPVQIWQANTLWFIVCSDAECSNGWFCEQPALCLLLSESSSEGLISTVLYVTGWFVKWHFIQDSGFERERVDRRLSLCWESCTWNVLQHVLLWIGKCELRTIVYELWSCYLSVLPFPRKSKNYW